MKKYILFAGVNGAGKTTLYKTNRKLQNMPRINVDEIVRKFGNWDVPSDVMKAGGIAVSEIKHYFKDGISFNQETTLCGRSILGNIKQAKNLGYTVEMYYVGLDSAEKAIERVEDRMKKGGHGIPERDIRRRYSDSLRQLKSVLSFCDRVELYDNTTVFTKIGVFENGTWSELRFPLPEWCKEVITIDTSSAKESYFYLHEKLSIEAHQAIDDARYNNN